MNTYRWHGIKASVLHVSGTFHVASHEEARARCTALLAEHGCDQVNLWHRVEQIDTLVRSDDEKSDRGAG